MRKAAIAILALFVFALSALAQSNTGRLVGTVSGPDGVVPGATVVITDDKTNKEKTIVSGGDGGFIVPQLEIGTYTIKVTATGFKSFTANEVKIDIGRDYSLPVTLEVGDVQESVTITAGNDVLNATTGELSNTISKKQILELPLLGRNPLNLLSIQAGVSQNGAQNSSINGLRTSFTNITRDGINVQDGFIRSNATDFSPNRPSVDDTGEFTIVLQNSGADQNGGAQVRLVTPRGESKFHGAGFLFNRNSALAANTFFSNRSNIPIPFLNRNNLGGRISGPMPLPRFGEGGPAVYKDKAFFFFAYEGIITRQSSLQTRTILLPSARQGTFTYNDTAGTQRTVNLLSLLPASAGITGIDSTVNSRFLSRIPTTGNRPDVGDQINTTGYSFNQKGNQDRKTYTSRLDFDFTEKNSFNLVISYNDEANMRPDVDGAQGFNTTPDVIQSSTNKQIVGSYRWTPAGRFTNEVRLGTFRSVVPFTNTASVPAFYVTPTVISNPEVTFKNQGRTPWRYELQDNAELNVGSHTLRFGGALTSQAVDAYNDALITRIYAMGTNQNTPNLVAGQFTGGISVAQLGTANGIMALLGGIISAGSQSFNVASRTDTAFSSVTTFQDFRYQNHSAYAQDSWRVRPNLTLTLGLRYELFSALKIENGVGLEPEIPSGSNVRQAITNPNGRYVLVGSNLNSPGQYYKTDKNNFAPILSFSWSPKATNTLGRILVGDGRTVFRGSYRWSYLNDQMITVLNNAVAGNSGLGRTGASAINPNTGNALLNTRIGLLPDSAPITPPAILIPRTYAQNNTAAFGNFGTVFAIDPDLQTPRVDEYSFGIQREFGANVLEVRYAGNRSKNLWRGIDLNQINITSNGFLADFNRARANLQLTGNPACTTAQNAGCQTLTVFPLLTNGGNLGNAAIRNTIQAGNVADLAQTYVTTGVRGGVSFYANPNTGAVDLVTNGAVSYYNSLQVEFRRRISRGLAVLANYSFQKVLTNGVGTSQALFEPLLDNARPELEYSRADYDQNHILNFSAVYELPIGTGRRFGSGMNRFADAIIGGWQLSPILRMSSGAPITIIDTGGTFNRTARAGRQTPQTNLTVDQIKKLVGVRVQASNVWFIDPAVTNTTGRAAEGFGTTPFSGQVFFNNGPGQTGSLQRAVFNGPKFVNLDVALAKNFRIKESVKFQVRLEAFNALNHTNFFFGQFQNIASTNFGKITGTFAARVVQLGGRIDF
ncbi:MAG: TonB-dependent receptor [Blastocatellia bacterium]|nr:TonB-dependent receptor [Blastocatellia bacterium]